MTQQNNYRFITLRLGANKRSRHDSAQPFVIYIMKQLKNKTKKSIHIV
jgi:serine protease inhibitor ecotin